MNTAGLCLPAQGRGGRNHSEAEPQPNRDGFGRKRVTGDCRHNGAGTTWGAPAGWLAGRRRAARRRGGRQDHPDCRPPCYRKESPNTFWIRKRDPVENATVYGRLYGVDRLHQRVETLVERFGLAGYRSTLVRMLSRGTQQRLSLARALLPDPRIVLLDEPDSGLDPQGVDILPQLLELADLEGRTTLLTTHNLKLGLVLAQRIAILAQGRLVWEQGTPGLSEADGARPRSQLPKALHLGSPRAGTSLAEGPWARGPA